VYRCFFETITHPEDGPAEDFGTPRAGRLANHSLQSEIDADDTKARRCAALSKTRAIFSRVSGSGRGGSGGKYSKGTCSECPQNSCVLKYMFVYGADSRTVVGSSLPSVTRADNSSVEDVVMTNS